MIRSYIYVIAAAILLTSCNSPDVKQEQRAEDGHKTSQTGFLLCHEPPVLHGEKSSSVEFRPVVKGDSVSRKVNDKAQQNLLRWASYSSFDMPIDR